MNMSKFNTASLAHVGTKAELLAMIEQLKATVENQEFKRADGWCGASSLCHVGNLVDQATRFLNGTAE